MSVRFEVRLAREVVLDDKSGEPVAVAFWARYQILLFAKRSWAASQEAAWIKNYLSYAQVLMPDAKQVTMTLCDARRIKRLAKTKNWPSGGVRVRGFTRARREAKNKIEDDNKLRRIGL